MNMRRMVTICALQLALGHVVFADTTAPVKKPVVDRHGDNTKRNDPTVNQVTADQQTQKESDVKIAASIRKTIVANNDLSTYAHNVKVVVRDGMVTLAGPVRTIAERTTVEQIAANIVGANKVRNDITVVSSH